MTLPMRIDRGRSALELAHQELNDFFGRFLGGGLIPGDVGERGGLLPHAFGVDISEDEERVTIEADMPGFRKEDIELTLENGTLTIVAERRDEEQEQREEPRSDGGERQGRAGREARADRDGGRRGRERREGRRGNYLLRERRYERFVRSFMLPPSVEEQDVQARLEDGVLRIELKKRAETKSKRIQIG